MAVSGRESMDHNDSVQNLQKMVQAAKMYYYEGLTQEVPTVVWLFIALLANRADNRKIPDRNLPMFVQT